jgi:hypothetical protein
MGFGWCLEGSQPLPEEDEMVDLKPWQRKRKRLDVLRKKTEARNEAEAEKKGKNKETQKDEPSLDKTKGEGDGLGQVGRLCIWCVK